MSDYTITTNFGAKDSLPSGNAGKVIKGSEFTTEFTNIQTAIATKADTAGDTFTGVVNFSADVAVNTNTLFVDVSEGKVGIGTASPAYELDIEASTAQARIHSTVGNSVLRLDSVDSGESKIFFADNSASAIGTIEYHHDNNYMSFDTVATERMRIDSSGNVGIGTSSPAGNLHISSGTSGDATLILEADTNNNNEADNPKIQLRQDSAAVNGEIYMEGNSATAAVATLSNALVLEARDTNGNNHIQFVTGGANSTSSQGTTRMTIKNDGKIGINTTSPASTLHVNGIITSTANPVFKKNVPVIEFRSPDGTNGMNIKANLSNDTNHGLQFEDVNGLNKVVVGPTGDVSFYNETNDTTAKFRWDASAERLGIGTNLPARALHVTSGNDTVRLQSTGSNTKIEMVNTGSSTNEFGFLSNNFFVSPDGTERMRIDSSGNVGIGTDNPASTVHIQASANALQLNNANEDTYMKVCGDRAQFGYRASDGYAIVQGAGGKGVAFGVNNATFGSGEVMRIDSSGNVGIGTSNPDTKLDVTATQDTVANILSNGSYAAKFSSSTSGIAGRTQGILLSGADANTRGVALLAEAQNDANAHDFVIATSDASSTPTERMRIDSSGNLLVGTTDSSVYDNTSGGNTGFVYSSNSFLQLARETTTATQSLMNLNKMGSDGNIIEFYKDGSNVGSIGTDSSGITFASGGATERMRIDSSGNVLVGKTSSGSTIQGVELNNSGAIFAVRSSNPAGAFDRKTTDGDIVQFRKDGSTVGSISVTGSATSYNTSSDERLKENIADSDDAGSKVDAIQIRQFDWKADGSHQDYGVIAQELVEVAPEAVSEGDTEEEMMGVDYSKLVPMLIKEVQSLRSRVAELENV
jgi:hypothetical protein